MSVYLDASVLVALFMEEAFTERAQAVFLARQNVLFVRDFAAAEFASAVARRVRTRELLAERARLAFDAFDSWAAYAANAIKTQPSDIARAAVFVRRLDLPLRTPDAIHVAIALRVGATLATFDDKLRVAATTLGLATEAV